MYYNLCVLKHEFFCSEGTPALYSITRHSCFSFYSYELIGKVLCERCSHRMVGTPNILYENSYVCAVFYYFIPHE